MAKQVCVDALVYFKGAALPERNDASITIDVDIAEAKPFVANMASAYASKTPTWKTWSASLNGYWDDSDDSLQNSIKDGDVAQLVIYPTRSNLNNYWYGTATMSSFEQSINSEDYSELNCDFEGSGTLTWISV